MRTTYSVSGFRRAVQMAVAGILVVGAVGLLLHGAGNRKLAGTCPFCGGTVCSDPHVVTGLSCLNCGKPCYEKWLNGEELPFDDDATSVDRK